MWSIGSFRHEEFIDPATLLSMDALVALQTLHESALLSETYSRISLSRRQEDLRVMDSAACGRKDADGSRAEIF